MLTKEIKNIGKENTTRPQMKLIDKLNPARKDNNFWKASKILPNQNQTINEKLPMKNQEAADAFAKAKNKNENKRIKNNIAKHHEDIVSLTIRETCIS